MTLIAAQLASRRIEALADGLSCHDNLTITRSRSIGTNTVQNGVPGRTTLQKIFPHPEFAIAIAHCGCNQRNGMPIGKIVERFWSRVEGQSPESLVDMFNDEFGFRTTETSWLLGWHASGCPIAHFVGTDSEHLDGGRCWAGSGRNSLSRDWLDLISLRRTAERFLGECQKQAPFDQPFYANCYGGHWHCLQLLLNEPPTWLSAPRRTGVVVSELLPGQMSHVRCDNPTQDIADRGEAIKEVLRQTFKVSTVRGALKRIVADGLRERVARLIAIFDEVKLDSAIATEDDARRYTTAVDDAIALLDDREI